MFSIDSLLNPSKVSLVLAGEKIEVIRKLHKP